MDESHASGASRSATTADGIVPSPRQSLLAGETKAKTRGRRRLWLAAAAIALVVGAYLTATSIFAYTEDAYVQSDLVRIAPEVAGVIKTVVTTDNQPVKEGDLLALIDPVPFALDVDLKTRQVALAQAQADVKSQAEAAAKADVDAANAALQLAQQDFDRVQQLIREGNAPEAAFDKDNATLRRAKDALAEAQADAIVSSSEASAARADVSVAQAQLAITQYALSRTRITAPVDGFVNNLSLRPGAYVAAGEAAIGIVDGSQWRVVANFKEEVAAAATPGTRVWVWLDSDPWRLYRGTVQGIGRGIARSSTAGGLLPYVAPTTDWIRLRRRLPVTIHLDPPLPSQGLFMGSDARVFFQR